MVRASAMKLRVNVHGAKVYFGLAEVLVTQYHVNGFRFDLMALLGVDTMKKVSEELHAIDPHIILYGEPWTGGTSGLPASQLLVKGMQKGLGIGVSMIICAMPLKAMSFNLQHLDMRWELQGLCLRSKWCGGKCVLQQQYSGLCSCAVGDDQLCHVT